MRQFVLFLIQRVATVAVGWISSVIVLTPEQEHHLGAALIAMGLIYVDAALSWYKKRNK